MSETDTPVLKEISQETPPNQLLDADAIAAIQSSLNIFQSEQEALARTLASLSQQVGHLREAAPHHPAPLHPPPPPPRRSQFILSSHARGDSEFFSSVDMEEYAISTYFGRITGQTHTEDPIAGRETNELPQTWYQSVVSFCQRLSTSSSFDYVIGLVLLINSICVGVEVQTALSGPPPDWALPLDIVFIALYVFELSARLIAWGCKSCFTDGWFFFDFISVVLGFVGICMQVFSPLMGTNDEHLSVLNSVIVVRSLRLLRLVRALRMLKWFRTAWRLVFGLITSGTTMASTLGLIILTLYVSACLGVELITKDEVLRTQPETSQIVQDNFGSIAMTMLTLAQFVTLDSIAAVYTPLVYHKPLLVLYFSTIILVVSISLMNLVTAVLVEGALENAQHDRELKRHVLQEKLRKAAPKLSSMFESLDVDHDGTVSLDEFMQMSVEVFPQELFDNSSVSSLKEVFELLDVSGKGFLSQSEFVEGLLNMFLLDVPIHTIQILRLLRLLEARIHGVHEEIRSIGHVETSLAFDAQIGRKKDKEIMITRKNIPREAVRSDDTEHTNQVFTNNIAINQIVAEHLGKNK